MGASAIKSSPILTRWATHKLEKYYIAEFLPQAWKFWAPRQSPQPIVVLHLLSCVWLFATPWTAARQSSLSFTTSQSLLKLMSIESMMPPSHLSLCCPLLLLPSIFPSIRIFPVSWLLALGGRSIGASASVLPMMNIQGWFPLVLTSLISLQCKVLPGVYSRTTVRRHQFFGARPFLLFSSHIHTWLLEEV